MREWKRLAAVLACCGVWGAVTTTSAGAQLCGDADGNGTVNVTDGVQVLRSAAGLTSTCTAQPNNCNIDGAGEITVTDGVNVLRKAAGLPVTENCPGGTASDVSEVTDRLVPFLTLGLREVPGLNLPDFPAAVPAGGLEDCEDGGSRETTQSGITVRVDFTGCKVSAPGIGAFQLDGFIRVAIGFPTSTVLFELNVTDLESTRLVDFDGELQGTPLPGGGFVIDGGPISVRDSEGGPVIFTLVFDALTVDDDGSIRSGSVEAEDTSDSFDLRTVELEVEDGNTTAAELRVRRDDDTEQLFLINLETGAITPAT